MARTKEYRHYCPVARSLEVVGEKWSLLVVRDLLFGPLRFSDLLGTLGGITPKLLTTRLRELEQAGIVEREQELGRREVWYRLTPKGRDLRPVVEALVGWGIQYARPPEPGEALRPVRVISVTTVLLNRRRVRVSAPTTWVIRFGPEESYAIRFDGESWSYRPDPDPAEADLRIETIPADWTALLAAEPAGREQALRSLRVSGPAARVEELRAAIEAARG